MLNGTNRRRGRHVLGGASATATMTMTVVLALVGCWPAPGHGPDRNAYNPDEHVITAESVASLDVAWTVDTGDGPAGAPIVSPDGVHARGGTVLHTLDPGDGAELWTFDGTTPGSPTMSDPIWQDGEVFVGYGHPNAGGQWQARSLDAATGTPARDLGSGLVDSVRGQAAAVSSLGFGSNGPIITSLGVRPDLDDPASWWSGVVDVGSFDGGGGALVPATAGTDGVYHAGRGLLTTTPGPAPATGNGVRMFGLDRPPSCYTGSTTPYIPCPQWATPVDGATLTPPVLDAATGTVYAGTNAGTLYALDAAAGAVRWTASVGAAVTASPALAGGTLFVPTGDGDLTAVAAGGCGAPTCPTLWSAPAGSAIAVQPAVAGGVVFTGSADGTLHGFAAAGCEAATCAPLWTASTGSRITGAPAVSDGHLYAGTQDGRLIAYTPDGTPRSPAPPAAST